MLASHNTIDTGVGANTTASAAKDASVPDRDIILVGKTGTGKSSVFNMLVQGDMFKENQVDVSDKAQGVTTDITTGRGFGWAVTDTAGLGECGQGGTISTPEALEILGKTLRESRKGFHHIGFVIKKERLSTTEHKELFDMFNALFAGAEKNFVLIVTHCDYKEWLDDNRETIQEVFGTIPVIGCDFRYNKRCHWKDSDDRKENLASFVEDLKKLNTESIQPKLCHESSTDMATKERFEREVSRYLGIEALIDRISTLLRGVWESKE
ncbi:hypothetical protein BGX27_009653 [Mortierella sp. AM989]|nr:hypothetical protein BGX27_009653 [Mortierella sp. AM989]